MKRIEMTWRRCAFLLAMLMPFCAVAASEALNIGSRLELFVDHYLIDAMEGARLQLHAPIPGEKVLAFDQPWEGRFVGYVTVLQDDHRYLMYYRGLPVAGKDGSDTEVTCVALSVDGVHWERPHLGLFEVNGTLDNNVILAGHAPFSHNFSPFLDTRPGVPGDERFKALAGTEKAGLAAFVSADGFHWRKLREEPVITDGKFDSQNVAFWSETEATYVSYFRTWSGGDWAGFRTISRATSPDFINWSPTEAMSFGDAPMEHLYTNQTLPYFRAPHLYTAICARFMPGRRVVSPEQGAALGDTARYSGDCSDTVFMTSRGGIRYDRTFMEGFVRPGVGLSNWMSRTNYPSYGLVPTGPATMAFYIQRNYAQPTHYLQRMILRTDGFASVHAPYEGGEMRTKPLIFAGGSLAINYSTSAAGSVWVEIQDAEGKPLTGFTREDADEIIGDEIERTVTWKDNADLSALAGKPIRLRFIMKDADLYAIRFK